MPITIELERLHVVLGIGHIHELVFGRDNYEALEPNMYLPEDAQDEEGITLRKALGARKTFVYAYDCGDN